MRPPVSRGEGRASCRAVMGGMERIPSREETKAAPVR